MVFEELNFDGLMSSAIPETDVRKVQLLAIHTNLNGSPSLEFQIMIANGQLETPIALVEKQFEVGDITF